MLVLTRAAGESVVINEKTIATVAVIGPDFVDLSLKNDGWPATQDGDARNGGLAACRRGRLRLPDTDTD